MANIADLNPEFLPLLNTYTSALGKAGIGYRVESGYRSPEQQAEIYARSNQGRSFAAAPPWRSFHNYGLAADVIPNSPADYARMHDLARQAGLYDAQGGLGFTSYDPPHVEMPGSLSNLISQYNLANWRPASSPAPAQGAIAYAGPLSQPSHPDTPTPTQTTMFGGLNADARGMRNNNPGNLVANDWTASLPGYKGSDGKFAIFDTPQHGALALDQNLAHYGTRGINTPLGIASTWAPASDNNNPNSYGAQIAKALGVGPNGKIDINNPAVRAKVAQAIGLVENGPGKSSGFSVGVPGTTINAAGGPTVAAGGPAAPAAPFGSAGNLPGFEANSPGAKMTAEGLKGLGFDKGAGGNEQPPSMPAPMQLPPAQAIGGPMMMGAGQQNLQGRQAAWNALQQQGFMMQPSPAAFTPAMPGTTLNSPSQLQLMALQAGQLKSPYDTYANPSYYTAAS